MEFKVTYHRYCGLRIFIRIGYRALELKLKGRRYLTTQERIQMWERQHAAENGANHVHE